MALSAFNGGSSTYNGENAGKFINAAFQASKTLKEQAVKIMPNIKFKEVIQDFSAANVIDAATCAYTDGITLNVNEVVIEPLELQSEITLCKQTFHNDWQAKYQMMSAHDNIPNKFEDYLIGYLAGLIGSEMETLIWRGENGASGAGERLSRINNGFVEILNDSSAVPTGQKVVLAASQTTTNIVAQIRAAINAVPARVYSNGAQGLVIYLGASLFRLLVAAYGDVQSGGGIGNYSATWWDSNFQGLSVDGFPVYFAPGMDAIPTATGTAQSNKDAIVVTYKDNLIFGTGLMNDFNYADVIDRAKIDGSRNIYVVFRYTAGVQVGNVEDCVLSITAA